MLEMAKQSSVLECFTHVSTAYVNSDKTGRIAEKIYPLPGNKDPEQLIDEIMRMTPE